MPTAQTQRMHSTLITRLDSANIGNIVLSQQLQKLFERCLRMSVVSLERYPPYLAKYDFPAHKEPIPLFKAYGADLLSKAQKFDEMLPLPSSKSSNLHSLSAVRRKLLPMTRRLGIRQKIAKLGYYDHQAIRRLNQYKSSSWVFLNPAGEIRGEGSEVPFRLFLDAWSAKMMGSKVGIVNFSVERQDEMLGSLISFLFPSLDLICVRDEVSLDYVRQLGLPDLNLKVVPDAAILFDFDRVRLDPDHVDRSGIPMTDFVPEGAIGLAINGNIPPSQLLFWTTLIQRLLSFDRPLAILSSEYSTDVDLAHRLARGTNARVQPCAFGPRAYCHALSNLSAIISSRLHTIILATVCGTPSIGIEPENFKLQATLRELELPIPIFSPTSISVGAVDACLKGILQHRGPSKEHLMNATIKARRNIEDRYRYLLTPASSDNTSADRH